MPPVQTERAPSTDHQRDHEREHGRDPAADELDADRVAAQLREAAQAGAAALEITDFAEPSANAVHGHAPTKGEVHAQGVSMGNGQGHDVRWAFGVNPDLITDEFPPGVVPNGHEAVHALLAGRTHLIDSSTRVFVDTYDADDARWDEIEAVATAAPIPPGRRAQLEAHYA